MNTFDNNEQFPREQMSAQEENAIFQPELSKAEEPVPVQEMPAAQPPQPPQSSQSPQPHPPVARKESPFANSPYMTCPPVTSAPRNPAAPAYQPVAPAAQPVHQQQAPVNPVNIPPVPGAKPAKKRGFWKKAVAAVLVLVLVAGSSLLTGTAMSGSWERKIQIMRQEYDALLQDMNNRLQDMQEQLDEQPAVSGNPVAAASALLPSQVYANNVDAVVMIHCEVVYNSYGQAVTGTSTGSGFIISQDGYIVTNHHVIEGATTVSVSTPKGATYAAAIIGSDSTNDVALLKVNATGLPYAALGSSAKVKVGDQVVAIGNPLGELTSTMTVGYISGKERAVNTDGTVINMIQTDAAINSGNSGGPLFNMKGEVIGITTAKYSGASSSGATIEGIGFAIPIDDVMGVVDELMTYGYIKSAYMGVVVREMNSDMQAMAAIYNLPVGLYVDSVEANGPASKAGIQAEDIIVKLGATRVTSLAELTRALRQYEPGDTTTVTVYRAGAEVELTITLTEKPHTTNAVQPDTEQPQPNGEMPQDGSYEEWYNYFFPFFGKGPQD